jgi:type IV pilus assembly protein PilA
VIENKVAMSIAHPNVKTRWGLGRENAFLAGSGSIKTEFTSEGNKGENMKKQKGFSLIELLIVVAIILIIAAIAIPNLLRARIAANESSAVSSVRTMNTAQVTFQSTYPTVGYSSTVAALGPAASSGCTTPTSSNACLVDWVVAQASTAGTAKSGYYFGATPVAALNGIVPGYTLDGIPASVNQTGVRGFCSNEDAVIRFIAVGSSMSGGEAACAAYTALQ